MSETSKRPIVIVLGMHRSGTSLCAHVLSALGFDMADEILANEGNARGHWERRELVDYHDRVLATLERSWFDASHPLAMPTGWWIDPRVRVIRRDMIAWLRDRMGVSQRFGFKDPRTSLLLPLWKEILHELDLEPRYMLCVRSPADVARSLAARGDVPNPAEGEHRWLTYNTQIVVGLGNHPVCILPFEDWFAAGSPNISRMARHLVLDREIDDPTSADLLDFIVEPSLRHHSSESASRSAAICQSLYNNVMASVDSGRLQQTAQEVAAACFRFEHFIEPVRRAAMRVAPLEAEVAALDAQCSSAAAEQDALRLELSAVQAEFAASRSQLNSLLSERDELRRQLATKDISLATFETAAES